MDYYADGLHLLVGCSGFAPPGVRSHPIVSPSVGGSLLEHMAQTSRADAKRLQGALRDSNTGRQSDTALLGPERQNTTVMELEAAHALRLDRHFRLSHEYVLEGVQAFGAAVQIAVLALADFYHWTQHQLVTVKHAHTLMSRKDWRPIIVASLSAILVTPDRCLTT